MVQGLDQKTSWSYLGSFPIYANLKFYTKIYKTNYQLQLQNNKIIRDIQKQNTNRIIEANT